jgi:4-diphosphocytidyl-2-C-methyl-D-erythritol kinase
VSTLRRHAPAKVNLALAVTGRRDDGYHLLRSVFLRLALHDVLEAELDPSGGPDSLSIEGELEATADNLVLRATALLREALGLPLPGLRFRLQKRIPTAAGLGGGSSDAAAALELAFRVWSVQLRPAQRLGIALRLGADVPFFTAAHDAAVVEGIGEHVAHLPPPDPPVGLVLITPEQRLSTADVFAELDRRPSRDSGAAARVDEMAALLGRGIDGPALAAATQELRDANDLWPPAIRLSPGLAAAREAATRTLGRAVMLSGSGPTLFAVYPSEAAATHGAISLQSERSAALEDAVIMATTSSEREADP